MSDAEYAHDIDGDITPMTDINVDLEAIMKANFTDGAELPRNREYVEKCMTAAIRADRGERYNLIKAELSGLKNRLQNYNDGTYGKARIPMNVELKKIEAIQALLDEIES